MLAALHRLLDSLRAAIALVYREVLKFGMVGAVAYVVDVSVFNVLRLGPLSDSPLGAKASSVAVATVVAWLGNRYWTFRRRRRASARRELVLFVVMNAIGMGIALVCLWISHYVLGFTSPLADNIAANVVGLALGTAFRFYAYRTWVFSEEHAALDDVQPVDAASAAAEVSVVAEGRVATER